jgi:hypothetical protein
MAPLCRKGRTKINSRTRTARVARCTLAQINTSYFFFSAIMSFIDEKIKKIVGALDTREGFEDAARRVAIPNLHVDYENVKSISREMYNFITSKNYGQLRSVKVDTTKQIEFGKLCVFQKFLDARIVLNGIASAEAEGPFLILFESFAAQAAFFASKCTFWGKRDYLPSWKYGQEHIGIENKNQRLNPYLDVITSSVRLTAGMPNSDLLAEFIYSASLPESALIEDGSESVPSWLCDTLHVAQFAEYPLFSLKDTPKDAVRRFLYDRSVEFKHQVSNERVRRESDDDHRVPDIFPYTANAQVKKLRMQLTAILAYYLATRLPKDHGIPSADRLTALVNSVGIAELRLENMKGTRTQFTETVRQIEADAAKKTQALAERLRPIPCIQYGLFTNSSNSCYLDSTVVALLAPDKNPIVYDLLHLHRGENPFQFLPPESLKKLEEVRNQYRGAKIINDVEYDGRKDLQDTWRPATKGLVWHALKNLYTHIKSGGRAFSLLSGDDKNRLQYLFLIKILPIDKAQENMSLPQTTKLIFEKRQDDVEEVVRLFLDYENREEGSITKTYTSVETTEVAADYPKISFSEYNPKTKETKHYKIYDGEKKKITGNYISVGVQAIEESGIVTKFSEIWQKDTVFGKNVKIDPRNYIFACIAYPQEESLRAIYMDLPRVVPDETLDVKKEGKEIKFDLVSATYHGGLSDKDGHYMAIFKCKGKWFFYDDTRTASGLKEFETLARLLTVNISETMRLKTVYYVSTEYA